MMNCKKWISICTAAVTLSVLPVLPASAEKVRQVELDGQLPQVFEPGDVDMDGVLTGHDAAMVSRYLLDADYTLTELELQLADVNEDGVVNQADADWIFENQVYQLGDVDLDGHMNLDDAYKMLFLLHSDQMGKLKEFTRLQQHLMDVDANGRATALDLQGSLEISIRYSAECRGAEMFRGLWETDDVVRYYYDVNVPSCNYSRLGDVDQDGVITGHDTALVSRYLAEPDIFCNEINSVIAADVNADGTVDQADVEWIHAHEAYPLGDVDMDGKVTMEDAFLAMQVYSFSAARRMDAEMLTLVQWNLADTDASVCSTWGAVGTLDGILTRNPNCSVTLDDVYGCLQIYAKNASGNASYLEEMHYYIPALSWEE